MAPLPTYISLPATERSPARQASGQPSRRRHRSSTTPSRMGRPFGPANNQGGLSQQGHESTPKCVNSQSQHAPGRARRHDSSAPRLGRCPVARPHTAGFNLWAGASRARFARWYRSFERARPAAGGFFAYVLCCCVRRSRSSSKRAKPAIDGHKQANKPTSSVVPYFFFSCVLRVVVGVQGAMCHLILG